MFIGQLLLLVPILFIRGDMKREFSNGAISLLFFFISAMLIFSGGVAVFGSSDFRAKVEKISPFLLYLLCFFTGLV